MASQRLPLVLAGLCLLLSPGGASFLSAEADDVESNGLDLGDSAAEQILASRLLQLKGLLDEELNRNEDDLSTRHADEDEDEVDALNALYPSVPGRKRMSPTDFSFARGKKSAHASNLIDVKGRRDFFGARGSRIPNPDQFFGSRGKRQPTAEDFILARGERAPAPWAFVGSRGKKAAPSGFSFARGKKEAGPDDVRQSLLDHMKYYMQLRSTRDVRFADNALNKRQMDHGFHPSRGKRDVTN